MRVFITGGTGFIGTHIVAALLAAIEGDIRRLVSNA
jgi:nucleoside-diphosphate-sugar epimerase